MARSYKRDSRGRFAGGGGSGGSSGGRKSSGAKPSRSGPRGGKVGTRTEQARAKKAQQQRTSQFQGKTTSSGAKAAYKAAARGARMAEKRAAARPAVAARPKARVVVKSLEHRKLQNAVRKGIRQYTTSLDRRSRRNYLATAERKLANLISNPPRNSLYGTHYGKMLIEQQRVHVESLRQPLPSTRKIDKSAIRDAAKKRHLTKRLEKRNRKFVRSLETARRAGAWYQKTGTMPASMRKKKQRRSRPR